MNDQRESSSPPRLSNPKDARKDPRDNKFVQFFAKMGKDIKKSTRKTKEWADRVKKHKFNGVGKLKPTPDEEYLTASSKFIAIQDAIVDIHTQAQHFQTAISDFLTSISVMSNSFASTNVASDAEMPNREHLKETVLEFTNKTKESVLVKFCEDFISSLEGKMEKLNKIRDAMEERRLNKNEYDYYYEKVRRLRQRESEKAKEKAGNNERKLADAKSVLQQSSSPLLAVFLEYESTKGELIKQEFEEFKQIVQTFFSTGNLSMSQLQIMSNSKFAMPQLGNSASFGDVITGRAQSQTLTGTINHEDEQVQDNSYVEPERVSMDAFEDDDAENEMDALDIEGVPAVALFDFEPNADDEVGLKAGDKLTVLVQNEGGWWEGQCNGTIGLFPSNYVKLL